MIKSTNSILKPLRPLARGSEWHQIDPKLSRGSIMLIYDQFGIIQNLETSFTVQASFWLVSRVFLLNRLNCEVVRRKICKFDSIEALAPFCYEQIHCLEKVNLVLYSWWFSTLLFPHWKLIEFSKRASNIWLKYLCVV